MLICNNQIVNQPKYLTMGMWVNKLLYNLNIEYYTAIKSCAFEDYEMTQKTLII